VKAETRTLYRLTRQALRALVARQNKEGKDSA